MIDKIGSETAKLYKRLIAIAIGLRNSQQPIGESGL